MDTRADDPSDVVETAVVEIHTAIEEGTLTVRSFVDRYLTYIDAYDDELNAILTVNSRARERADELDAQFREEGLVGPLHGVPRS